MSLDFSVEWYNTYQHSFRREGDDMAKVKGSVDLDLILEMRDEFE